MPRADWARRTSYVSSSSFWGERDLTQAQEVILAHQSQHPFVIGLPVFAPEQSGNPPVAIVAMSDCQALNGTDHSRTKLALGGSFSVVSAWRRLPSAVITSAETRLSIVNPNLRVIQPNPPPR
jgi:hypothetical protein